MKVFYIGFCVCALLGTKLFICSK